MEQIETRIKNAKKKEEKIMASAKQIKARKLFAKRVKRGDFKKAITKTKKSKSSKKEMMAKEKLFEMVAKAPSSKRSLEKVQQEAIMKSPNISGEESGGILKEDNSWHVLIDGKEYVVHLDPAYFKKYGYKVGDKISIDAELDFFFSAMHDVGLSSDNMADMSKMNNTLNPKKFKEYKSR
jgi:hypothetical protein